MAQVARNLGSQEASRKTLRLCRVSYIVQAGLHVPSPALRIVVYERSTTTIRRPALRSFFTFSVYKRRRLLDLDQPKRIVLGVLNHQLRAMSAQCVGFVLMPEHVHAMIWLPQPEQWRRFLHGWKRMSSLRIRKWYREHAPNYFAGFGEGERFWQPKAYMFHAYSQRKLEEKLHYMHENPERAGLVQRAADWQWSSARWYLLQRSVGVPVQWIEGAQAVRQSKFCERGNLYRNASCRPRLRAICTTRPAPKEARLPRPLGFPC